MAFYINSSCTNCGECDEVCPLGAIEEGFGRREINANYCEECGTCWIMCKAHAIQHEDD